MVTILVREERRSGKHSYGSSVPKRHDFTSRGKQIMIRGLKSSWSMWRSETCHQPHRRCKQTLATYSTNLLRDKYFTWLRAPSYFWHCPHKHCSPGNTGVARSCQCLSAKPPMCSRAAWLIWPRPGAVQPAGRTALGGPTANRTCPCFHRAQTAR